MRTPRLLLPLAFVFVPLAFGCGADRGTAAPDTIATGTTPTDTTPTDTTPTDTTVPDAPPDDSTPSDSALTDLASTDTPGCGDGVHDAGEACDDGPQNGQYGFCAADCQSAGLACGDGIITAPFETCDDGALNGTTDACPSDCNATPGCGDGTTVTPEVCDDGADNGQYGHCAADCSGPGPRCGDAERNKGEACDDGDDNGTYGACAADCLARGPRCGDHLVEASRESCDDGADNGTPGHCNDSCSGPTNPWIEQPHDLALRTAQDGLACSEDDLFAKYLHYRLRLRGNGTAAYPGFVVHGRDHGMGMPAARREPAAGCAGHWKFSQCPRADLPDAQGFYQWGDGTSWLGEYIGLLALEHAMFTKLGLATAETDADLRDALAALDRLDEYAETFFPDATPIRDGLFLRDDIPAGFEKQSDGSYRWPRDDGQSGYECVASSAACEAPELERGSFTSEDQSISLIYGLTLVEALVPHDLVVDGIAVAADAREKIHRLVWFLRKNGWRVKGPDGKSPPDAWGGNAIGFSNAMAKAANAVVGDEFGVNDYRTFASRIAGEVAWLGIQALWEATHGYNRTLALRLAAANGVWGATKVPTMSLSDGKDAYALGWALIQDRRLAAPFSDWRVESLLHSAPCGGPCRGPGCALEALGWMGESRMSGPQDRYGSRHTQGEFNGIDYMFHYAAYFLYRNGHLAPVPASGHVECRGYPSLGAILAGGATNGQVYRPGDACAQALDHQRLFCGRPFGAWLDDVAQKKVSLYAGGGRWTCAPGGDCTIALTDEVSTSGDDLILGTEGDDALEGGAGNDCLVGFGGSDVLAGNQGYDTIDGGPGDDTLYGEGPGLIVDGEGDILSGGSGNDLLYGGPGKDELDGGDDDDRLEGGVGDDALAGGAGNDHLFGEAGEDVLAAGPGDDWLEGGDGSDTLWGGAGRDRLDGGAGDDGLLGDAGPDFIRGGAGDDTLFSGDEPGAPVLDADRLCGNGGDDTIWGGGEGDTCLGGSGPLGGADHVYNCVDGSTTAGDCDEGAYNAW